MAESVFSKIVKGEIPCYEIASNDSFLAFLDIAPLVKGHTILIPKHETDYIFDIDDDEYKDFFVFAKKIAAAIKLTTDCRKVGIAVVGLEVPHAHIHLIPLNTGNEINFQNEKLKFSPEEFKEIANSIANNLKV